MNWTFIIIAVAAVVLIVLAAIAKHYGLIPAVGIFGKLLSFVEDLLVAAGWVKSGSQFDKIARIIVNGIILVYTSGSDGTPDDKVSAALNYITSTAAAAGITLTDDQINVIKGILMTGFKFLTAKQLSVGQQVRLMRRVVA